MEALTRVRAVCLALPEATEKVAWGSPTFRVRDKKMFAAFADNHHGDDRVAAWMHAPKGAQELFVGKDPDRYFIPPYVGVKGWIGLVVDAFEDEELAFHAREAYCQVAPKKLIAQLESEGT